MAYKTFANGFPLPASDLNNFLMNQSVIVFADSAARTTAIPSPVTGMLTYLVDTAAYESWNGSAYVDLNDNTDAIPKSTVTTAQDLIVADGASSVTRLGVGTDDQVLSVVAGEVAWADAGGGGGGFNSLVEITATNSSYTVPTLASNIVKFTVIAGGGAGGDGTTSGSSGGNSSVTAASAISATGGLGGYSRQSIPPDPQFAYASSNWGNPRISGYSNGDPYPGYGGQIKIGYLDLTGYGTINVQIGAGGESFSYAADGFSGIVVMEYSA
jgi:hypothetical protein